MRGTVKKIFLAIIIATLSNNLFADFIVRNESDDRLKVFISYKMSATRNILMRENIKPRKQLKFVTETQVPALNSIAFKFDGPGQKLKFSIPTWEYGLTLHKAKKYVPIFTVTKDPKTGAPIVNIPQDEKALQEAIEKTQEPARKEKAAKISREVSLSTPLPCHERGVGGVSGIVGEYAAEVEPE